MSDPLVIVTEKVDLDTFTRRYVDAPPPGILCQDRVKAALLEACRAVDRDIQNEGAATYDSVQLVRGALALARRAGLTF